MQHSQTIQLAQELIKKQSVTPDDAGCQALLSQRLKKFGFRCEEMAIEDVTNLWARRGDTAPLFVFAGHTDVVPTGPVDQWSDDPFSAQITDGILHGRGAADMKGSIASFMTAAERFVENHPDHIGSIGLLITSDEEGPAQHGTKAVMDILCERDEQIDLCIVGEPTSTSEVGDVIKVGRRGSLNGILTITGIQGHIAYPQLADNPIHTAAPILDELTQLTWDAGNEHFPPTSFQVSNIHSGTGATNVIPGDINIVFNLRFSPEITASRIQEMIEGVCQKHTDQFHIEWNLSGVPFETKRDKLIDAVCHSIEEISAIQPELSTSGGTSDGRFISPKGAQVIELGPVNATIHQIDEQIKADDLDVLSAYYERILEKLLLK